MSLSQHDLMEQRRNVTDKRRNPLHTDLRPIREQLGVLEFKIPYQPRPQMRAYHARKQRFALTVAHRRFGKTVAEVLEGAKRVLTCTRTFPVPQVAFISPIFAQGKRNAWPYLRHYMQGLPGMDYQESTLTATFPNGGKYFFAGSDNPDSLRGVYLDHASLDEYGSQDPRIWGEVVRPALSDYKGTATFIGSAKGRNHFYTLLKQHEEDPDWLITILKASETGILSQDELDQARSTMSEDQYQQEYECNFDAAVTGTFYGKDIELAEKEQRITGVPYDKVAPVFMAWDLGIGNAMAVWTFQIVGREYHFLEYHEKEGVGLDYFIQWIKERAYKIEEHFLPHDVEARELQTGKTRLQFLQGHGLNVFTLKKDRVEDGIHACKMVLNRCWFDKRKCAEGVDSLRMYRTLYNSKTDAFTQKPLHDWSSNGADAFRYAIMGARTKNKVHNLEEQYANQAESWMR